MATPSVRADEAPKVLVVTMNDIPGYSIVRTIGFVSGLSVRSRNWGTDIATFVRSSVGGELTWLTTLTYRARDKAMQRMTDECIAQGGNAIIACRFETCEVGMYVQTAAYGTACIVQQADNGKDHEDGAAGLRSD